MPCRHRGLPGRTVKYPTGFTPKLLSYFSYSYFMQSNQQKIHVIPTAPCAYPTHPPDMQIIKSCNVQNTPYDHSTTSTDKKPLEITSSSFFPSLTSTKLAPIIPKVLELIFPKRVESNLSPKWLPLNLTNPVSAIPNPPPIAEEPALPEMGFCSYITQQGRGPQGPQGPQGYVHAISLVMKYRYGVLRTEYCIFMKSGMWGGRRARGVGKRKKKKKKTNGVHKHP